MPNDRATRAKNAATQRQAAAAAVLPAGADTTTGEVVKTDPLRQLLDSWKSDIVDQMPTQLKVNPEAFLRMVLTGMRTSKQAVALAKCTRPSLFAALLESARFGLTPFTDEAAIVPYGDQATFIPMAQGFVRMFWNTGQVSGVVVDFIRRGELRGRDWDIARGEGGGFYHRPRFIDEETGEPVPPGEPILAYCYLRLKDGTITEPAVVTRWDAEDVMRNRSKAWANAERTGKRDSLWHTDFPAMWLKTAVRRSAKYGPKSAELVELLLIEAREDRTRGDGLPALTAAPAGSGASIDWSKDIAGGNVVPGEVIGEDGFPAGSAAAPPPNGNGDQAPDTAKAGPPPAAAQAGATAPDTKAAPTANGHTWPDIPLDGPVSRSTGGKLSSWWQRPDVGWTGDENRERRRLLVCVLAAGQGNPPLDIASPAKLTERQARTFVVTIEALAAAAEDAKEPLGDRMARLYDAVTAQQQAARG
jgi:recombination protein RecT